MVPSSTSLRMREVANSSGIRMTIVCRKTKFSIITNTNGQKTSAGTPLGVGAAMRTPKGRKANPASMQAMAASFMPPTWRISSRARVHRRPITRAPPGS